MRAPEALPFISGDEDMHITKIAIMPSCNESSRRIQGVLSQIKGEKGSGFQLSKQSQRFPKFPNKNHLAALLNTSSSAIAHIRSVGTERTGKWAGSCMYNKNPRICIKKKSGKLWSKWHQSWDSSAGDNIIVISNFVQEPAIVLTPHQS